MINCKVCGEVIKRGSGCKISCNDCLSNFHAPCVKVLKEDIDYFKSSGVPYRCDKCRSIWRSSMIAAPSNLTSSNNEQQRANESNSKTQQTSSVGIASPPPSPGESEEFSLRVVCQKLTNLEQMMGNMLQTINDLRTENTELKTRVQSLESKLNWQQQHQLKNCIEITGVPNINDANAKGLAQHLLFNALAIEVPDDKIVKCYVKKVLRKKNSKDDKAPCSSSSHSSVICLTLSDSSLKQNIMRTKSKKKNRLNSNILDGSGVVGSSGISGSIGDGGGSSGGSGTKKANDIYINDALTSYTRALFMKAKEIKKQKGYKYVWYRDNKILMRMVEGGKINVIRSFNDPVLI